MLTFGYFYFIVLLVDWKWKLYLPRKTNLLWKGALDR